MEDSRYTEETPTRRTVVILTDTPPAMMLPGGKRVPLRRSAFTMQYLSEPFPTRVVTIVRGAALDGR